IAELLRGHCIRIVGAEILIAWLIPICTPVAFVLARIGIVDDHSVIAVAISDVRFIFFFVDEYFSRASQVLYIVAAFALAGLPDLYKDFPGLRKFQPHRVVGVARRAARLFFILLLTRANGRLLAARRSLSAACGCTARRCALSISANPDVAFVVDGDPMVRIRPVITLCRTAPTRDQIAFLIELQYGRCRCATLCDRRIRCRVHLAWLKRACAVDDPNVVLSVYRNADGLTKDPVIG